MLPCTQLPLLSLGSVNANHNAIPAAGIDLGKMQITWDTKLLGYLKGGILKPNQAPESAPRNFICPSDHAQHQGIPRSYAMAGNDMSPEKWPPGRESATGVGLKWDKNSVVALLGEEALQKPDELPAVSKFDVPAPAETALLAELISPNNKLGDLRECNVIGASRQRESLKDDGASFHDGKFNYLMFDGHVERLSPLQTGSYDGTGGIWSLKKR
jgi:prepilin-type processing-associated H-X9-DG protein